MKNYLDERSYSILSNYSKSEVAMLVYSRDVNDAEL